MAILGETRRAINYWPDTPCKKSLAQTCRAIYHWPDPLTEHAYDDMSTARGNANTAKKRESWLPTAREEIFPTQYSEVSLASA